MDDKSNSEPPGNSAVSDLPSPPFVPRSGGAVGPLPSAVGAEPIPAGSSTARYKTMSPASLPISRSPCLTIPPGLSPTTLLESPILLSNIQLAEPSPTTGTFSFHSYMSGGVNSGLSDTFCSSRNASENLSSNDVFKTHTGSGPRSGILDPGNSGSKSYQNDQVRDHGHSESHGYVKIENTSSSGQDLTLSIVVSDASAHVDAANAGTPGGLSSDECHIRMGSNIEAQSLPLDQKGVLTVEKTSEDGYNWRKYGQKLVKGSEFPRSYYKCTHPNCQMKKKLERSHDGSVIAIIYEGAHDHPKPQPSRRLTVGSNVAQEGNDRTEALQASAHVEDKSLNARAPNQLEPNGFPEPCSAFSDDDDGDGAGPCSDRLGEEAEDDDPESKRRKIEAAALDNTLTTRTTREPRVVLQTLSEVDILDDGYRWRKYGQKVVKGNPNPRSYYKCTNAGCPVRKHVERASHDPKAVITTYEGKHNHDVPTGNSSSQEPSLPTAMQSLNLLDGSWQYPGGSESGLA